MDRIPIFPASPVEAKRIPVKGVEPLQDDAETEKALERAGLVERSDLEAVESDTEQAIQRGQTA